MTFDPAIIRRDHGQAVFHQTFLQFSDRMVGGGRMPNGLAKMKQHAALFATVEKQYGVPAPVLTAFWGLESDFGVSSGKYKILSALATLAYDCRRPEFFRQQLLDALRIVERGDQRVEDLNRRLGRRVRRHAVHRRPIISRTPSTSTATAAATSSGAFPTRSPPPPTSSTPWAGSAASPGCRKCMCRPTCPGRKPTSTFSIRVSQWVTWGVKAAHGALPSDNLPASLILPMGRLGPAFLAYPNFKAFLGWNSAFVYSTTVAYFATRLNGAPALTRTGATTVVALSPQQIMELQRLLVKQGYDGVGEVDGKFGDGTRAATKKAQIKTGLPADSYPTAELIERLGGGRTGGTKR